MRVVHKVLSVFRDQTVRSHPLSITGKKGIAALKALVDVPFRKLKWYHPSLIDFNAQGVQQSVDLAQLARQEMTGNFLQSGTAKAEDIAVRILGYSIQ